MRPEISVIIPCFNAEIYIPRCIEKLEQQTFKSFEVVIVDDCSSDNSVELLRKIEKKTSLECLIIELNKNSGPGNARNIGIENARGNYVSFCDIDDYYEPDFLKIMYEEIKNQNAEIMMCNSKLLFKDGSERKNSYTEIFDKYKEKEDYLALSRSSKRVVPLLDSDIKKYQKRRDAINHVTVMFKKSKVLEAGNYQHALLMEDSLLWTNMILHGAKFKNIDKA